MKKPVIILFFPLFVFLGCVYAPKQAWKPSQPVKDQTQTYQPVYIKQKKKKQVKQTDKEKTEEKDTQNSKKKDKKQDGNEDKTD